MHVSSIVDAEPSMRLRCCAALRNAHSCKSAPLSCLACRAECGPTHFAHCAMQSRFSPRGSEMLLRTPFEPRVRCLDGRLSIPWYVTSGEECSTTTSALRLHATSQTSQPAT